MTLLAMLVAPCCVAILFTVSSTSLLPHVIRVYGSPDTRLFVDWTLGSFVMFPVVGPLTFGTLPTAAAVSTTGTRRVLLLFQNLGCAGSDRGWTKQW